MIGWRSRVGGLTAISDAARDAHHAPRLLDGSDGFGAFLAGPAREKSSGTKQAAQGTFIFRHRSLCFNLRTVTLSHSTNKYTVTSRLDERSGATKKILASIDALRHFKHAKRRTKSSSLRLP